MQNKWQHLRQISNSNIACTIKNIKQLKITNITKHHRWFVVRRLGLATVNLYTKYDDGIYCD